MRLAGREVGRIGFGTAPLAFSDLDEAAAVALVELAIQAGVGLIDTALAYTRPGRTAFAEEVIGSAIRGLAPDERPLIATKGGHWRDGDLFPVDGSPAALRRHCETSLRALGVERIDLYQLHHVDPALDFAEQVEGLAALQQDGLVTSLGLSNVTVGQLDTASSITRIASVQNRLSLLDPADAAMAAACAERGVAYIAYAPLGGGGDALEAREPVAELAARAGVSVQRVALAWAATRSPAVLPIVGSTRRESLLDSLGTDPEVFEVDELDGLLGDGSAPSLRTRGPR